MANTQDNIIFNQAVAGQSIAGKPFLHKELLYVVDNNGGSGTYDRNQIEFETSSLVNSRWADYENAFITIPFVCTVERSDHHITADAENYIHMKSGIPLIDKYSASYNGDPLVSERDAIAGLVAFNMHTQFSQDDLAVKGEARGYHHDSSKWSWDPVEGLRIDRADLLANPQWWVETGHDSLLSLKDAKSSGFDTYEAVGDKHVYKKLIKIFLKDLPGFSAGFPVTRGGSIKLTMRLNQGSCVRTKRDAVVGPPAVDAGLTVVNSLKGASVPIMVTRNLDTAPFAIGDTETIIWGVGQVDGQDGEMKSCRLYVPSYVMEKNAEETYMMSPEKTITFDDYLYVPIRDQAHGQMNVNLTNGVKRARALLIIPQLSASSNMEGVRPQESLVYGAPSISSPCQISDFNVMVAGGDVYSKTMQYRYENFQHELAQGRLGLNAGLVDGLCSSLISEKDYNGPFYYLYSDLSHREDYEDLTNVNIAIRGNVKSPKTLDFHCYVIYEKTFTINVVTGEKKM